MNSVLIILAADTTSQHLSFLELWLKRFMLSITKATYTAAAPTPSPGSTYTPSFIVDEDSLGIIVAKTRDATLTATSWYLSPSPASNTSWFISINIESYRTMIWKIQPQQHAWRATAPDTH
jgi:hypothetical protein